MQERFTHWGVPVFLLFIAVSAAAQPARYQFTRLDMSNGLSHNQVNCILKDEEGFVWFGTMSGLNRYDGYNFKAFKYNRRDTASLSDNYISAIFPLPENRLWIDTRNGVNIYNPRTENFDHREAAYLEKLSLPAGTINRIVKDRKGNFWFLYNRGGLYRYDPSRKQALSIFPDQVGTGSGFSPTDIMDLKEDQPGNYWLIRRNGLFEEMDGKSLKIIYRSNALASTNIGASSVYNLFIDRDGCCWIYVTSDVRGVYCFDPATKSFQHLSRENGRLNNDLINGITQDNKGLIWIGTDHGGINLVDKKNFSFTSLLYNPEDDKSISQNSIYSLYKDNTGIIWAGTYKKGAAYYNENLSRFPLYKHEYTRTGSLSYDDINRFAEDPGGNLWIGTNGGGLIYFDRKKNIFRQYLHDPHQPNSLCNDVIVALCLDHENKLWIGTYYGGLDCFDGKTFIHYRHNPGDPHSLSNNSVWDIYEDYLKNLWIGTLGGGLDRFDRQSKAFVHYPTGSVSGDPVNFISVLTGDASGNLWIGTAGGIEVMNIASGKITGYVHRDRDSNSLSNDNVISLLPDSRGWVWVGTREGLNLFDTVHKTFRLFTRQDGLPDNTILTMLEDHDHNLWIATPNGLSNMIIRPGPDAGTYSFSCKNYDELDGLQGREFNEKAAYETRGGELAFGGPNGFNLFDPSKIRINTRIPPVILTDLQIFNRSVQVGEKIKGHVILSQAMPLTASVTLPFTANDFSIEFAALSFAHSEKNQYAYELEGFNKDWITADGNIHKATYTNLDPGKYIFRVKAANNDGVWNEQGASLVITVLPPFWRTPLAYLIYALLITGALWLARRIILEKERMNFRIAQQQREAQRMHELDMMKIRFFTNISHEFRTPLTLILSPIEKLVQQQGDPQQKKHLQLIQRNAKRLLNLVNQLLDFRKLEVQEIRLNPVTGDIIRFILEVANSFTDIAEKKNIRFTIRTGLDTLETEYDPDKLERILFNLLSNAFKFTPENGGITLSVELQAAGENKGEDYSLLQIKVRDTGIGIPPEKLEKIFERFFQHEVPGSVMNQGSGIGLSITREFVRLHKGLISAESEPGKGSCFTVVLPLADPSLRKAPSASERVIPLMTPEENRAKPPVASHPLHIRHAKIMLVEDNEDFRFYLKDNLQVYYHILEAANGKEAWNRILAAAPDLVVSDIMMPEMNGIELSKKLKKDPRTESIPLILLSARVSEEQQIEGYETGANDYITKPFNFEILLSRIRNLLAEKKLQKKAAQAARAEIPVSELEVSSQDEKLLKDAVAAVEKNMDNPDFSVEELSRCLFISRVALYKKLLAITGKTPIEFIRTLRLKRAAQLLQKSGKTVAEVAYEVGFNNPKAFAKYFRQEYHTLPSEYARQKEKEKKEG